MDFLIRRSAASVVAMVGPACDMSRGHTLIRPVRFLHQENRMFRRRLGFVLCFLAICAVAGVSRADEPVLLRYKLTKGATLIYKSSQEMKQTQTINGTKIENSTMQDVVTTRNIEDVDENGTATLKTKAVQRKVKAEFAQAGKYEFDSKSTERDTSSMMGAALTPLLERLTGSEYEVQVNPRGQIVEVKGFAELVADLAKDNPLTSQFAGGGTAAGAKISEQESFLVLGEDPVKPGDQWERSVDHDIPAIGKVKGKVVCVFEGYDKVGDRKTVRIGVTTNLSLELNIDAGGAKVTGTISTTQSSGTVQFDPEAGRVVSSKNNMSLSGQLTAEAGGMTFTIDSQQEQTATNALLEKVPD
jgi:hypothetical protein